MTYDLILRLVRLTRLHGLTRLRIIGDHARWLGDIHLFAEYFFGNCSYFENFEDINNPF